MSLDYRHLRAFLAVIDQTSIGRAARHISLSQPALSRLIQEMESRLTARLFDRHPKGMLLTPFGEALLPHARSLMFEHEQAMIALDVAKGLQRGTVRIGAPASVTRGYLPDVISDFLGRFPGLRIELLEGNDKLLTNALSGREIDLMVTSFAIDSDEFRKIGECDFNDTVVVVCSSGHRLASEEIVSLDDVMHEDWATLPKGTPLRDTLDRLFHENGRASPRMVLETASADVPIHVVKSGRCLGWLPYSLCSTELAAGTVSVLHVPELVVRRRFYVVSRRLGTLPTASLSFIRNMPFISTPAITSS